MLCLYGMTFQNSDVISLLYVPVDLKIFCRFVIFFPISSCYVIPYFFVDRHYVYILSIMERLSF